MYHKIMYMQKVRRKIKRLENTDIGHDYQCSKNRLCEIAEKSISTPRKNKQACRVIAAEDKRPVKEKINSSNTQVSHHSPNS